jgi:prepilin-type N-terminal cleavage/methylation domain-containing protein
MKRLQQLKNKKGFSLVELLIVIAIMAVLVGVLAPQYIRYVERSRQSADIQVVNNIANTIQTIVVDPMFEDDIPTASASSITVTWATSATGDNSISLVFSSETGLPAGAQAAVNAELQAIVGTPIAPRSNLATGGNTIIHFVLQDGGRWRVTHAGHSATTATPSTDRNSWDHALRNIRN